MLQTHQTHRILSLQELIEQKDAKAQQANKAKDDRVIRTVFQ